MGRVETVDRLPCRSPHGERGLKCGDGELWIGTDEQVALLMESVD